MLPLPTRCPLTGGELIVTRLYSPAGGITIEGEFAITTPFAQLSAEQLKFVETFVRCEGKLNRMESEMKLSYPTLRSRLHEIVRALGAEPDKEEAPQPSEQERRRILEELNNGQLTFAEAMQRLKGETTWNTNE